jgi:hypothetical protein
MNERFQAAARATLGLLALVLLVAGCKPFSGPLPGDPTPEPYFIQHLSGEGTFPLGLDLGAETRDVYLTFVNPNLFSASGIIGVGVVDEVPSAGAPLAKAAPTSSVSRRAPTPEAITTYNQNPFGGRERGAPSLRRLEEAVPPQLDIENSNLGGTFYNIDLTPVLATCRKIVPDVAIAGSGTRTLNIWVADDCWDATAPLWRTYRITQAMVNALADTFLLAGGNTFDDIYDWVTDMLGPEWGPTGFADLIPANDEITILLCDIENDDSENGGVVGYFWSKDNYTTAYETYSSERVMFTIDAVMYANGDIPGLANWQPTDYWPEEIYSTLAHEFQHMIHFYQRGVLRDAMSGGDTWINEMASQVVEDLLADKMNVIGPRGVDGTDGSAGAAGNTEGRLPWFNAYNDVSLADWGGTDVYASYSITYAFGAWLARNYGGAMLMNRLMQCTTTGRTSIEDIVSQATGKAEYFPRLMQRWSAAQLLSDATDAPPGYQYNTGTFFDSTVSTATYRLGSINLFNYSPAPKRYTGAVAGTSPHRSTSAALYQAATSATGSLEWALDMPPGLIASLIVK